MPGSRLPWRWLLPPVVVLLSHVLVGCAGAPSHRAETPADAPPAASAPAPSPTGKSSDGLARETLSSFVEAVEREDFTRAHALLASPLRRRYTPATLRRDFHREPLAAKRLENVRRATTGTPKQSGGELVFPIDDRRAVRLVAEPEGFRIATIE